MAGTSTIRTANFLIDFALTEVLGATVTVTADFTCARPFAITDARVLPLATVTGATAQLSRQALGAGSFVAVTNAMAMAASGTIGRATSIAAAERSLAVTDVLRCSFIPDGTNAGGNGRVYANVVGTPITGA